MHPPPGEERSSPLNLPPGLQHIPPGEERPLLLISSPYPVHTLPGGRAATKTAAPGTVVYASRERAVVAVKVLSGSGAPATRGRAVFTVASVATTGIHSREIAAGGSGTLGIIRGARIRVAEGRRIPAARVCNKRLASRSAAAQEKQRTLRWQR